MSVLKFVNDLLAKPTAWLSLKTGLAYDKIGHALAGALIAVAVSVLAAAFSAPAGLGPLLGALVAGVAGGAKEVWDWRHRDEGSVPDPIDALVTLAGGVAGALVVGAVL